MSGGHRPGEHEGPGGRTVRLIGGPFDGRLRLARPGHGPEFVIAVGPTSLTARQGYCAVRYDAETGRIIGYVRPKRPARKPIHL